MFTIDSPGRSVAMQKVRSGVTTTIDEERLTDTVAALAKSTRRATLGLFAADSATMNNFTELLADELPATSKDLTVRDRYGLMQRSRNGKFRQRTLHELHIWDAASCADDYRLIWEERFDRMQQDLQQLQATHLDDPNDRQPDPHP